MASSLSCATYLGTPTYARMPCMFSLRGTLVYKRRVLLLCLVILTKQWKYTLPAYSTLSNRRKLTRSSKNSNNIYLCEFDNYLFIEMNTKIAFHHCMIRTSRFWEFIMVPQFWPQFHRGRVWILFSVWGRLASLHNMNLCCALCRARHPNWTPYSSRGG